MIKGVIGYKVVSYKDVEPILMKLRSYAMQFPGFVGAENLVSEEDYSVVVMISTWETMEHWRSWVEGAARVTAYRTMPTVEWR